MSPRGHVGPQCVVAGCGHTGTYRLELGTLGPLVVNGDEGSMVVVDEVAPLTVCEGHGHLLGIIDPETQVVAVTVETAPPGWRLYSAPRFPSAQAAGHELVLYPPGVPLPKHPYKK